ncbi:MAG TPA: hypothetical protein VJQ42_11045, partial [Rhodanobacteraceae bacterium]|nr:hypothetical protein [Rhodanobacteraceae bacterium]
MAATLPISAAISDNNTCAPARIAPARPTMGANSRRASKRRRRGGGTGATVAADAQCASVEQSAERIDGIARMASAPQLMDAPIDDLPLETLPTGLARRVGLVGFQQAICFMRAKPGQQRVGTIGSSGR